MYIPVISEVQPKSAKPASVSARHSCYVADTLQSRYRRASEEAPEAIGDHELALTLGTTR
jgi:hypothetical protein